MRRIFPRFGFRRPKALPEPSADDIVEPDVEQPHTGERAVDVTEQSTPSRAPLDSYRGVGSRGRLPQCPTCGRFRVHIERDRTTYSFVCLECEAVWAWSVGEHWPRTTPRADLHESTTRE